MTDLCPNQLMSQQIGLPILVTVYSGVDIIPLSSVFHGAAFFLSDVENVVQRCISGLHLSISKIDENVLGKC